MRRIFSKFYRQRLGRALIKTAFVGCLVCAQVFAPFTLVIRMPDFAGGPKLGVEIQRAHAAFGNGYEYRRSITINESQVTGTGDHTNFPVMISFTETTFRTTGNGGNVTDAQGDDIIFTSDQAGSTVLDFEVERYTAATGEIIAWVEVPTLDFDNNTVIYMFYGNSSVTSTQEDVAGTWDGNFVGVWHMDGDASTQLDSADASVSQDGTVSGATSGAAGKIGPAYDFDGTNDVITVTDQAELDITNTGTIEAWMRTDDVTTWPSFGTVTWATRSAPDGAGISTYSGVDSVIVGDSVHYGAALCNTTTETFRTATSSLNGASFSAWTNRTVTNMAVSASAGGCSIGVDSDGVHIWYAVLSQNAAGTETFSFSTSTPDHTSFGAWRSGLAAPDGSGSGVNSSIDIAITGNRVMFTTVNVTGATEDFDYAFVNLDGSGFTGWVDPGDAPDGSQAGEGCSHGTVTDGVRWYSSSVCNAGGTETYEKYFQSLAGTQGTTWSGGTGATAPAGAGATDFDGVDSALVGGTNHLFWYGHSDTTEVASIASSSPEANPSAWTVITTTGAAGAGETTDAAIESDGKALYMSAFAHNGATETFTTASTSLPAHPFVSKLHAYEMLQVGNGFVFDWAGKPTTFGTTTAASTFYHVAVTNTGSTMNYYINGALYGSTTVSTDFASNANNLLFGQGARSDGSSIFFNGIVDEIRVSNTARSADWIQTQYNNQNATSTFYTLGSEENNNSPPTITTNFASNVGATSAMLNGSITATGGDDIDQHGFAYSTDSALSTGVSTSSLGTYTGTGNFQGFISGLSSNQTYYFRAYGTNNAGTGYGVIRSLFTGNSNITRSMRLFEGSKIKLVDGKLLIHQR